MHGLCMVNGDTCTLKYDIVWHHFTVKIQYNVAIGLGLQLPTENVLEKNVTTIVINLGEWSQQCALWI